MSDWVTEVTEEAMRRLMAHADKVGLHNTEEFTLRAFFMSAAHDLLVPRRPIFATEWKKFDLLVQRDNTFTIVEFKYYVVREKLTMDGVRDGYKGGAGPKNEAEFIPASQSCGRTRPAGSTTRAWSWYTSVSQVGRRATALTGATATFRQGVTFLTSRVCVSAHLKGESCVRSGVSSTYPTLLRGSEGRPMRHPGRRGPALVGVGEECEAAAVTGCKEGRQPEQLRKESAPLGRHPPRHLNDRQRRQRDACGSGVRQHQVRTYAGEH